MRRDTAKKKQDTDKTFFKNAENDWSHIASKVSILRGR